MGSDVVALLTVYPKDKQPPLHDARDWVPVVSAQVKVAEDARLAYFMPIVQVGDQRLIAALIAGLTSR